MMLENNSQKSLQLPFEYHYVPDLADTFIQPGDIVSIDNSMGVEYVYVLKVV